MITSSPNRIRQNQILYNCLRLRCTKKDLMAVCEVIIAVISNPRMKDLGEDMKRMLERKYRVCSFACMTWCACTPQTTSSLSNSTTLVSLTIWLSTKNINPQHLGSFCWLSMHVHWWLCCLVYSVCVSVRFNFCMPERIGQEDLRIASALQLIDVKRVFSLNSLFAKVQNSSRSHTSTPFCLPSLSPERIFSHMTLLSTT